MKHKILKKILYVLIAINLSMLVYMYAHLFVYISQNGITRSQFFKLVLAMLLAANIVRMFIVKFWSNRRKKCSKEE